MRLDAVTAEIRPRSDWEAVDLGLALVRRDFWRCLSVWWLAMALPLMAGLVFLWDRPLLLLALLWWAKPAASRMVLFELSRRLFGEQPPWRTVLREIPRAWVRRFGYRFVWARFSPWLPVTLAVEDLEGLRGKAYNKRCAQLVGRGEGALMWIYLIADVAAVWFGIGLLVLVLMLLPEGQDGAWQQAVESWNPAFPFEISAMITRTVVLCVLVSMALTDVFVTGAGFGIYINNRTWIEGWDVELAFKRLAHRLAKVAVVVMSLMWIGSPAQGNEIGGRSPAEVIREVKADEAFKVHTVTERVPVNRSTGSLGPEFLRSILTGLALCGMAFLVGLVLWRIVKNRHALKLPGPRPRKESKPVATVVMGMDVSPDRLPVDVPAAAWSLWQQGRHHEALGLLYRGAISRVIEISRVEIQESDTEGDCLMRVDAAGSGAHPEYFRGLTQKWIQLAYAGTGPGDSEVWALCEQWPFEERSDA